MSGRRRVQITVAACMGLFLLLLFLNVWQAYRYEQLTRSVRDLEERQREVLEENKRIIAAISILRSPLRTGRLAVERLGLERVLDQQRILIEIEEANEDE